MENIIEIKNLKKKYDDKFELGEIDITIPKGVIVGLIGENGAGKTTLIKSMLNIIKIDSGEIKIFGKDYKKEEKAIKEHIGVVLDNMFFPELLNAKDINNSMKDIYIVEQCHRIRIKEESWNTIYIIQIILWKNTLCFTNRP